MITDSLGTQRRAVVGDWLFGLFALLGVIGLAVIAVGPWRYGTGTLSMAESMTGGENGIEANERTQRRTTRAAQWYDERARPGPGPL